MSQNDQTFFYIQNFVELGRYIIPNVSNYVESRVPFIWSPVAIPFKRKLGRKSGSVTKCNVNKNKTSLNIFARVTSDTLSSAMVVVKMCLQPATQVYMGYWGVNCPKKPNYFTVHKIGRAHV